MIETIKVKGMHCQSCKMLIEDALEDLGVRAVVDLEKEQVTVELDGKRLDTVKKVIRDEGYTVR